MAFGNLVISTISSTYSNVSSIAVGRLNRALTGKVNQILGKSTNGVQFVYDGNRTFTQALVSSAFSTIASVALNETKKLLLSQKKKESSKILQNNLLSSRNLRLNQADNEQKQYGRMIVMGDDNVEHAVVCRDYMGYECYDGLMLKIPTKKSIRYVESGAKTTITDESSSSSVNSKVNFYAKNLVFSDCTALITPSSDKNLILTKVAGRDYSRKELVSNGDINFSVSGHILSGIADVYPKEQVQKFIEIMNYKGIVEVNNVVLDQFNIKKIVIKDFSLSPTEGDKSRQDYSFNAVGIQPDSEVNVDQDTLYVDSYIDNSSTTNETETKWTSFVKNSVKAQASNTFETLFDTIGSEGLSTLEGTLISSDK